MDIRKLYRGELRRAIIETFAEDFEKAVPGACMKLTGLPQDDLIALRSEVLERYPALSVLILTDGACRTNYSVTATKLIELRNKFSSPLLVLIPSALQTPAEDSYGNATFKDLAIGSMDERILERLRREVPEGVSEAVGECFDFAGDRSRMDRISYLLALRDQGWARGAIGRELDWLGLIPDTAVSEENVKWRTRLYYNRMCSEIISDFSLLVPDRVSKLPIRPETNQAELAEFLGDCKTKDRLGLMHEIRSAENFSDLDFANWKIPEIDVSRPLNLKIVAGEMSSPHVQIQDGDKSLQLKPGQSATLKIRLTMTPPPKDYPELKTFRIMLVSTDGGTEVQEAKRVKVTSSARAYRDISIKVSSDLFEEGTYFLRAYGEDEAGNVLNREDDFKDVEVQEAWLARKRENADADHAALKREMSAKTVNETEDVYFGFSAEDQEDGEGIDSADRRKDRLDAAYQGYVRYRLGQLKSGEELSYLVPDERATGWLEPKGAGQQRVFHLKLGPVDNFQVCISNKLYLIEREFLDHPEDVGCVHCRTYQNPANAGYDAIGFEAFADPRLRMLLERRKVLFGKIRDSAKAGTGVFETWLDLCQGENLELVKDYVVAYSDAVREIIDDSQNGESGDRESQDRLVRLQNLDTVFMETPVGGGKWCSVKMMTPLHPLRLAWFINLIELFSEWEGKTIADRSHLAEWTRELAGLFLGGVYPSGNPLIFANTSSKYYQYSGEIVFGWGVWVQNDESRHAVNLSSERQVKMHVAEQLNLPCEDRIDTDVSEEMIGRYIRNYLKLHPYADKLIINVFNPGDGASFVRSLIDLEQKFPDKYQYEFRLYCEDDFAVPGEAFRELMNPESVISEKAESFSGAAANRLFPKMRFSINRISDFMAHAQDYSANMTFLVNPFVARCRLVSSVGAVTSDSLNGLIVKSVTAFEKNDGDLVWDKFAYCSEGEDGARKFYHEGNRLLNDLQHATAVVMNLKPVSRDVVPGTSVRVSGAEKSLIAQVHASSDWVVTFDKCIGPEIFDSQNAEDEFPYLLDYVPGSELSGVSAFLTARPGIEAYRFLEPYLRQTGLVALTSKENMLRMLEDIRAISGSLLMQAIATDNKAFEVIGLSLTKRMLEKKGYLRGAFLVPIDLHKDLFDIENDDSKERADILLVRMDSDRREIHFDVVEVKCRTGLHGDAETQLEEKIYSQIEHSIKAFRTHFEIGYGSATDRIDRPIKNLELRTLLEFYIRRAARFDQLDGQVRKRYLEFCAALDEGYSMSFSPLEIIYNFSASHAHRKEQNEQFTRYVIGKQLIDEIMDQHSDLNTLRLEETLRRLDPVPSCPPPDIAVEIPQIPDGAPAQDLSGPEIQQPASEPLPSEPGRTDNATGHEVAPCPETNHQEVDHAQEESVSFDTLVGGNSATRQFGLLGVQKANGRKIALDLSETTTISLFGVQGAGKSYTIGTIAEMVLRPIPHINQLPSPLAGVIFHYSESMDYAPEFTSMNRPNDKVSDVQKLIEKYGASPASVSDIVLLSPKAKVDQRKAEYPGIQVFPIAFKSTELSVKDWQFLLGAIGNDSMYIRQINAIMRNNRANLTFQSLRNEVRNSAALSSGQRSLAEARLGFAEDYIDDSFALSSILKPGRLVIVDLRDEFIEKDQALGLFVVMLNIFSGVTQEDGKRFNKFIVFDEAHKYMDNKDLTNNIVTAIREMRHKGVSLMIASQDPPSLPSEIIELSSVVLMHKFNSPAWLKHIQKSITSLSHIQSSEMLALSPGEAFVWANKSTDKQIETRPVKIVTRPRVTKHGGGTITAA